MPQGYHAHGLLARGREILDDLFPGLSEDLVARGGTAVDIQNDGRWYNDGHLLRQAPSDLRGLVVSRPLLETYVRSRVSDLPGLRIEQNCEVGGLLADDGRGRVAGVEIHRCGAGRESVPADLVVDATGRSNRGPTWLQSLGYTPAPEEEVDPRLVYVSRDYRRGAADSGSPAIVIGPTRSAPRSGVVLAGEDDRWMVSLVGMGDDIPSVDPREFEAFAAGLPAPEIAQLLARLEPLGPPRLMRIAPSVRRRYELLARFPAGYLAFGDALCQFNPSYGQGMTAAACQALVLQKCLEHGADGIATRFFPRAARVIDIPWNIAVGADLRFPSVQGRRTWQVRLLNAYVAKVHAAAEVDPVVGRAFLRVANLVEGPQHLFAPGTVARVLLPRRRRPAAGAGVSDTLARVEHRPPSVHSASALHHTLTSTGGVRVGGSAGAGDQSPTDGRPLTVRAMVRGGYIERQHSQALARVS